MSSTKLLRAHEARYLSERGVDKTIFTENYGILAHEKGSVIESGAIHVFVKMDNSQRFDAESYISEPHQISTEGNVPFQVTWNVWDDEIKMNEPLRGT